MGYADNDAQKLAEAQRVLYQAGLASGEVIVGLQIRIRRLETLLRRVRAKLAVDPAIWEAELINEIDEVVDVSSTH